MGAAGAAPDGMSARAAELVGRVLGSESDILMIDVVVCLSS